MSNASEQLEQLKKRLLEKLPEAFGVVTVACEKAGIGRTTYYDWRKADPEFAAQADQIILNGREKLADLAENMLAKKVAEGDTTSIIFALKTQGKRRGYVERVEQEIGGSVSGLVVKFVESDKD